jgi:hypothetical protein
MSLVNQLFERAIEELAEAHLLLDKLGSPREIDEGGWIRECLLAERIKAVLLPQATER